MAVQLRIDLKGSKPAIWRRVMIPAYYTFAQLHDILQILFGWKDQHMYEFYISALQLRLRSEIEEDIEIYADKKQQIKEASQVKLENLQEGIRFTYLYDFGDCWVHNIKVEKILMQDSYYPKLLKWKQDNACEDIGGIDEYYRLLSFSKKNDNPKQKDVQAWFASLHTEFDEESVESQLEEYGFLADDINDEPYVIAMRDMLDIFDYIHEDALFLLKIYDNESLYIWFHHGENEKNVRIYMNAYDCALSCLFEQEQKHVHPLFTNGIVFEYPNNFYDEIDGSTYAYQCYGTMEMDEFMVNGLVCSTRDVLCDIIYDIGDEIEMLPDANDDQKALCVHVMKNGKITVKIKDIEMQMVQEKAHIDPEMVKKIKDMKLTDIVSVTIFSIPNLLRDEIEDDIVYALVIKGEQIEKFVLFEHIDISLLGDFIVEHLFDYMVDEGKPTHLYCNDERIRQILRDVCKSAGIPLDYRCLRKEVEIDLYTKAIIKQNPPELFDESFLMHAEEIIRNEKSEKEKARLLHKMSRYMAYDTFVHAYDDE